MRHALLVALAFLVTACASAPLARVAADEATLEREVRAAETAFAQTMADRDFAAFGSWIADDAVFVNGGSPLRGKQAILAEWRKYFDGADAPFAWAPEIVAVLPSGALAQTVGSVTGADGKEFAKFYSTWRRDAGGQWRIVLDNGYRTTCPAQ